MLLQKLINFIINVWIVLKCAKIFHTCGLFSCLQIKDESATVSVRKEEEQEEKPEPIEDDEKKPEMKAEPKEVEEGGSNSTTSSSPSQSRRKSECDAKGLNKIEGLLSHLLLQNVAFNF